MVQSPRMSDEELLRINAAAVTREYKVNPHIGMYVCVYTYSILFYSILFA